MPISALEKLRQRLKRLSSTGLNADPFSELDAQIMRLTARVQNAPRQRTNREAMINAIRVFVDSLELNGSKEARLVCLGCTLAVGESKYRLIEDAIRFPKLLKEVGGFIEHRRVFRNCYKGLLEAYFDYSPFEPNAPKTGVDNWALLRKWLNVWGDFTAEETGLNKNWVAEVLRHPELFSDDPVAAFGRDLLEGKDSAFTDFRRALEIKAASWFTEQAILAQIKAATARDPAGFCAAFNKLFAELKRVATTNEPLFDRGLKLILDHYRSVLESTPHDGLREFAVMHWGHPDRERRTGAWISAGVENRKMVQKWVTRYSIQYFFEVLSQDGGSDKRRLEFWLRYHNVINRAYFALGNHARDSVDVDMVKARRLMHDVLIDMQESGAGNNAFIMEMGRYVVVEFGQKGNACFIFRKDELPFALKGGTTASLLKSNPELRMLHVDSREEPWERKFETELRQRRIVSDATTPAGPTRWVGSGRKPAVSSAQVSNGIYRGQGKPSAAATVKKFGANEEWMLKAECERNRHTLKDLRPHNGNLWVELVDSRDFGLSQRLERWGFKYKAGRGWWIQGEV